MILDTLENAHLYKSLHPGITKAFAWLQATNLITIASGKYIIDEESVFAIVQEYETLNAAGEQMEAHKKYIDVQYMIKGSEMVGLSITKHQTISKPYEAENDFMLFEEPPSFFARLYEGNFMIFYPTDLHMPGLNENKPAMVKKVVIKVRV
ncbi:YhcH/YjgK/YiaL family protein [soil metagenome]